MSTNEPLPPAALVITHPVAEWDAWKQGFDAGEQDRRDAGALGHHLNRSADDPNVVTMYIALSDLDRARAFLASDDLRQAMEEAGVTGPPDVTWMTPVREQVVWEGEHPAALVSHHVDDFDAWLAGYDRASETFEAAGIVGHAVNRGIDDPALVVTYHQADSHESLRAFFDSVGLTAEGEELERIMAAASVTSTPEISYHVGGWAKRYA